MAVTSDIGPRGPLLFFDGECALCHGAVRRILKWERPQEQGIMFAPLHGETAERLRQAGDLPEDKEAVILWTAEGTTQGEAAVGHVLDIIGRKGWARAFSCMPYALRTMGVPTHGTQSASVVWSRSSILPHAFPAVSVFTLSPIRKMPKHANQGIGRHWTPYFRGPCPDSLQPATTLRA